MSLTKFYHRFIFALLWFWLLSWLISRSQVKQLQTQIKHLEDQQEDWDAILNDPYLKTLDAEQAAWLRTPEAEKVNERVQRRIAMGKMRYAINRSQFDG
jgi:predicted S18 family serine protease